MKALCGKRRLLAIARWGHFLGYRSTGENSSPILSVIPLSNLFSVDYRLGRVLSFTWPRKSSRLRARLLCVQIASFLGIAAEQGADWQPPLRYAPRLSTMRPGVGATLAGHGLFTKFFRFRSEIMAELCDLVHEEAAPTSIKHPSHCGESSLARNESASGGSLSGEAGKQGRERLPLAASDRHLTPFLPLLAQPCGPFLGLTCKVHCGKGLPRRYR